MYNEKYMEIALNEAVKAFKKGEVPVGAVIVKNNKIISKAYNKIEKNNDATAHAEIIAIKKASKKIKNWRLNGCDLYVTLYPCDMCLGAIIQSRIDNIYYILDKNNNIKKNVNFNQIKKYNGYYLKLIKNFFKNKR